MAIKKIWYTGYELEKRWSISEVDLIHYLITEDLKAYPDVISEPYSKEDVKRLVQNYRNYPWAYEHGPWELLFSADNVLEFEKKYDLELLNDGLNKKDLPIDDIQRGAAEQHHKVFPCDPGTKWKDIKITLISHDAVTIETPNGSGRYHFSELSMKDRRKGDIPTMLWELLMYFCRYSGRISSETSVDRIFSLRFRNLSKLISDLNKKLQNVFEIDERFYHKYNKKDGWVAKCIFNDNTEST